MHSRSHHKRQPLSPGAIGFSLAELLVVLLILGQIAAFSIPKIVYSSQNARNKAILKETVGMLSDVAYGGVLMGEITSTTNIGSYFAGKINHVKYCPTASDTQGCWNTAIQGTYFGQESQAGGFILHNGAVIAGMGGTPNTGTANQMYTGFALGVNGEEGPNLSGTDIFDSNICLGPSACNTSLSGKYGAKGPGGYASGTANFATAFDR